MNRDEFAATSIAILGSAIGWQSAIGRRLGVGSRVVRRWIDNDLTPEWVDSKLLEFMGGMDLRPWPRDEWVIGDGVTDDGRHREYIIHTMPPRFMARIVACHEGGKNEGEPLPGEHPADVLTGAVYIVDPGTVLCEIEWFDDVSPGAVTQLLDAAGDAICRQDQADSV